MVRAEGERCLMGDRWGLRDWYGEGRFRLYENASSATYQ